jgi:hypothetical protein
MILLIYSTNLFRVHRGYLLVAPECSMVHRITDCLTQLCDPVPDLLSLMSCNYWIRG